MYWCNEYVALICTSKTKNIGFWKDVSYEMSQGKSKETAIQDKVKYYQKYKPFYFNHNEKK